MVKRRLAVLLLLLLAGGVLLTRAHGEDSASTITAQVEGRQSSNRRDLDPFTLQEIMQKWHVYPEQAAAGLWTTPTDLAAFVVEIQRPLRGPAGRILSQAMAKEMVAPVGIGPFGLGLVVNKRGEGWYFSHRGVNWGFHCALLGHVRRGYGVVVMTNSDSGTPVLNEVEARVAAVYRWDSLDKPIPR